MNMKDMTGEPRSERDLDEAERFLTQEMVRDPLGRTQDGTPRLIHYMTLRDVIKEVRELRAFKESVRADMIRAPR